MSVDASYRLSDRFSAERGIVFLTGIQALARLPIEQLHADRRAGLKTAAFVSGYPGSPLGGFDRAVASAAKLASDLPIVCQPAVNEEYAATAVMGSQLANSRPDARYDGVVGIWYGKAPGVDRASDALRHAAFAGTWWRGGAVAFVGDDPAAKSSTVPSSSAGSLADMNLPLLYPADPAEALDLGRHAVAMSRATGLWVALKIVADVADGTATVELDPDRVRPVIPLIDGAPYQRRPEGHLLTPLTLDIEREIAEVRQPLVVRYAADNRLNDCPADPEQAWIGIVASGITYREVREAFHRLGLATDRDIERCGIRLLKMRMPLPFDPSGVRHFARGLHEVLVIEEKQPNVETLIKDALYSLPDRPVVTGKHDPDGRVLVPSFGALDADLIIGVLRHRLGARIGDRLAPPAPPARERALIPLTVQRAPFYCSGCPHNRSTEVPPGTLVGAGIGCHTMTLLMDPARVGDIAGLTVMGNEGTQWIGMAPFVDTRHLVQNLGDGTYFHSGQLAIQAAVAAGVDITYKLLHNRAVAMTGGQQPQGQASLPDIVRSLLAHGVARVLVTTDDRSRRVYRDLPSGVDVWHRDRLMEAQRALAAVPGVTVLIHDQQCAAEARRARKRGLVATPTQRMVINHRVCEGCGDCGQVSNCLSVQPTDTPFGRKTTIDQTTCNLDYSCLEGDCPSFITADVATGRTRRLLGRLRPPAAPSSGAPPAARSNQPAAVGPAERHDPPDDFPAPVPIVPADDFGVRITGIGGTGVVTVAQVLGTAAMIDGYQTRGLDQIGLSQKAGPVVSDLRISRHGDADSSRLGGGQADLLLALDLLVASTDKGTAISSPDRTVVVGSASTTPTGAMITHPELAMPGLDELVERLVPYTRDHRRFADADAIATDLFGDASTANMFVVGMAVQDGCLPLGPEAIERAIALNGVAVTANTAAFRWGRCQVVDPDQVDQARKPARSTTAARPDAGGAATATGPHAFPERIVAIASGDAELRSLLDLLVGELCAFENARLAERFLDTVATVAVGERRIAPNSSALTRTVAVNLHRLLAYKDEYEVARLMLDPDALAEARRVAGPGGRLSWNLHPPLLRALGMRRKLRIPMWTAPAFRLLARGKALRGTVFDPFRWTAVRRAERALPGEYEAAVARLVEGLTVGRLAAAVTIAGLPDQVRGYEHLKLDRVANFRRELAVALSAYASTA